MSKRKTFAQILGGILIGGLLLTGGMAFAAEQGGRGEFFKSTLDQFVKEGVISQDKANNIKTYIDQKKGIFDELAQNKIITQSEADTLKNKFGEAVAKQRQQKISDSLQSLVEKGTITQAQADKIVKNFQDVEKEKEALFEKTKDMTMEDRRQYMQDNKDKFVDPLGQLVTDKVITQDQADAIKQVAPFGRGGHKGGFGGRGRL